MSDPVRYRDVAEVLHQGGYPTVPIPKGGKRPFQRGWQEFGQEQPIGVVKKLIRICGEWGCGIVCGRTVAVDLDIYEEEAAAAVDQVAVRMLGEGLLRIGRAPKLMRIYRVAAPFQKFRSRRFDQGEKIHQIEVLGQGSQFVAFAIHPDTQKPYHWVGASPVEVKHPELPPVSEAQLRKFVARAELELQGFGYVADAEQRVWEQTSFKSASYESLGDALTRLEEAEPHTRNNTLYWASCRLAEGVWTGLITNDEARERLLHGADVIKLDRSRAVSTIDSAFRRMLGK
jgi:hypothetical protein